MSFMTEQEVYDHVYARIGSERDSGVIKPIVKAAMILALNNVCKAVAQTKPPGHEKLLLTQSLASGVAGLSMGDSMRYSLSDFASPFLIDLENGFFHVELLESLAEIPTDAYLIRNHESMRLAASHGVPYYWLNPPYLYVTTPDGADTNPYNLKVTHYIFASITQFPSELKELLISEIIRIIAVGSNSNAEVQS